MSADRIRAARELLGLSQGELAVAAGLSQALISQLENGNRTMTESALDAIAGGTGLPSKFFVREPDPLKSDSLRFRKYRSAPAKATVRARRTFIELFDIAALLMDWSKQPTPSFPTAELSHRDAQIEDLADAARAALDIPSGEPVRHLTRALERAAIPVAPIVFADLSGDESAEFAAIGHFGLSACPQAKGRAAIGYFASSGDRQRFTLAHELGHLVLHSDGTRDSGAAEKEADTFAGAFLLPREASNELTSSLTLRDFALLKATWGVSIQALVMRAAQLGVIDDSRRVSLFKQISARGWRHNEPVKVHPEAPLLLSTLLAKRYGSESNAYTKAAADLGLPAVFLRSVVPLPNTGDQGDGRGTGSARVLEMRADARARKS